MPSFLSPFCLPASFPLYRACYFICVAGLLLHGCSFPYIPDRTQETTIAPDKFIQLSTKPLVAQETQEIADIYHRMTKLQTGETRSERQIVDVNMVDFLIAAADGREFAAAPAPRALILGEPASSCVWRETVFGAKAEQSKTLVTKAMEKCIAYFQTNATDANEACGCRIAAHDDFLFLAPEELSWRQRIPVHILWRKPDAAQGVQTGRIILFTDLRKQTTTSALALRDLGGKAICQMTISPQNRTTGDITLDCQTASSPKLAQIRNMTGTYQWRGYRHGRLYGTANLAKAPIEVALFLGHSESEYREESGAQFQKIDVDLLSLHKVRP